MIELNKEYKVKITDEDNKGNGITRINDFVVFVPYTLKDETVTIEIIKIEKRFGIGRIIDIIESSPCREEVKCSCYSRCGGCSFLHTSYLIEKDKKLDYINKLFNIKIDKCYFGNGYNYRNKAIFHVKDNKLGYYSENSHDLVELKNCLLLDKRINDIYKILVGSDISKLTSVMVRVTNNEVMIKFDGSYNYKELLNKVNIDSIYINDKLVYGKEYITEEINEIKYTIFPESFFQVNIDGMIHLYDIVKEYCVYNNKLLDLYCGTGTIGIYLKDNFNSITGVEINESNVLNANMNMDINNITNIKFILGDSKTALKENYDVIVVDPPRNGLSKDVIKNLNNMCAKIIYVSCNPNTLKKDIELFSNYKLDKLSVVNMFPKTKHIECVALLERNII